MSYVAKYNPVVTIDVASLTGACVVALGNHISGMMTDDDKLANELFEAGKNSGDPCWRLPLDKKSKKQLSTNYADIANSGGREAGAITAGCFLKCFAPSSAWAHLDIAGIGRTTKKRSSGRPVPLLVRFLTKRAAGG